MKKLVEYWMPGESLVGFQTLMMMIGWVLPKSTKVSVELWSDLTKHFHLTNALSNHSLLGEELVFVLSSRMLIQLIWCSFCF